MIGNSEEVKGEILVSVRKLHVSCDTPVRKLHVSCDTPVHTSHQVSTVATSLKSCCKRKEGTKQVQLLQNVDLDLEEGKTTLLLGPSGCGKTLLLKAISNMLPKKLHVEGTVNGPSKDKHAFISQQDEHLPLMSVRKTLGAAAACSRGKPVDESDFHPTVTGLSLDRCQDTIVGNAMIRGVSGGERRRTSIAEVLVLPHKSVLLIDELTTGLDSNTALDVVRFVIEKCRKERVTGLISALQPSPAIMESFDNLVLLSSGGCVIYNGPTSKVAGHFTNMGYSWPPGKEIGEVLVDIASGRGLMQISEVELAKRALSSEVDPSVSFAIQVDGETETTESVSFGAQPKKEEHKGSGLQKFKSVLQYQLTLLWAEKIIAAALIITNLGAGVLLGLLTFETPVEEETPGDRRWYFNRVMTGNFTAFVLAVVCFVKVPLYMLQRPVIYKHLSMGMYSATHLVIAKSLILIPVSFVEALVAAVPSFFLCEMVSLDAPDVVEVLFEYIAALFFFNLAMNAWMAAASFISPNLPIAVIIGSFSVAYAILNNGVIVFFQVYKPWAVWLYWLSPQAWFFRAFMVSVFGSDTFSGDGNTQGDIVFQVFTLPSDRSWFTASILVLVGVYILMTGIQVLSLQFLHFDEAVVRSRHGGFLDDSTASESSQTNSEAGGATKHKAFHLHRDGPLLQTKDLCYTVTVKGKKKTLLNNISATVKPGRLLALIGSTGAGKTTLIDVLAGRKRVGKVSGEILLNGKPMNRQSFRKIAGYVTQQDFLSATMTVRELIQFHGMLRNGGVDVEAIQSVLATLELTSVASYPTKHLAPHQVKRVAVAVELIAGCSLLMLDEPTSFLDARSAELVIQCVKNVANAGCTVLCTIHQPSSEVFSYFDDVLVLKPGGELVYNGAVSSAVQFFTQPSVGVAPPPEGTNLSTFMLKVVQDNPEMSFPEMQQGEDLALETPSEEKQKAKAEISINPSISTISRVCVLVVEWQRKIWRAPEYVLGRLFLMVLVNLVLGFMFVGNSVDSVMTLQNSVGIFNFGFLMSGFIASITPLPLLVQEKGVFLKEKWNRMYSTWMYGIATALAELPYVWISSLIAMTPLYFLADLSVDAAAFFITFLLYAAYVTVNTAIGHFAAATSPNLPFAVLICASTASWFSLFNMFAMPIEETPVYFRWLAYASASNYVTNGVLVDQYECVSCAVDMETAFLTNITCNGGQSCGTVCDTQASTGCELIHVPTDAGVFTQTIWQMVQQMYGSEAVSFWRDFGVLLGMAALFHILGLLALQFRK